MSKKIIIIDDDPEIVTSMRIVLEKEGYDVVTAHNGTVGMEKIRSEKPNVILLDIMMSDRDEGFQVSYRLKNDDELKDIPVVIISSVAQVTGFEFDKSRDGEFMPVDDYVEKPVLPKQLLDIVRKHLGG